MRAAIIATILLGFASSPLLAEPTVEELSQRIDRLEKTVETLANGLALLLEKPQLKAVVPAKPDDLPQAKSEVVINVRADGSINVEGKELTLEELKGKLKELAGHDKDQPVRIRGDAAVKYQRIVEVIDACQKSGLWEISFATRQAGKAENEDSK